jgi:hypothetical protein
MQSLLWVHWGERSCFILSTLKHLCRKRRFRHQWRHANHLASICHAWYSIPELLQFNENDLKNALQKDPALTLDIKAEKSSPNQFGIYHDTYRSRGATDIATRTRARTRTRTRARTISYKCNHTKLAPHCHYSCYLLTRLFFSASFSILFAAFFFIKDKSCLIRGFFYKLISLRVKWLNAL